MVEQNRYGAMTLRSTSDRTYQVVGSESPAVEETLARLTVGSEVTVNLARAHGRGNGWYVTAVDAPKWPHSATHEPTETVDQSVMVDRSEPSTGRESR